MELRPYQQAAVEAVERTFTRGFRSCLVQMPTGTGKTILFASLAERAVMRGERVLVLAHRGELLEQAIDKIRRTTGIEAGLEKADENTRGGIDGVIPYMVVVGSVQSMCRPGRLARFRADEFDLIVIDECHHALSNTYKAILEHFTGARVLGVTATPDRGDMRGLCEVFETIAFDYSIVDAVRDGWLCRIKARTIPLKIDLNGVAMQNGDFQAGGVAAALEPYLPQIAAAIPKDRKTVVFTPLIATSLHLQPYCEAAGLRTIEINGQSPDRHEKIKAIAEAGPGTVVLNSMLLTEGWDCPDVDCVCVLRATKVRSLFCQMVGRGTRLSPGKENLLILDFLWLTATHELCRPASLLSASEEVKEVATQMIQADGVDADLTEELLESAESETVRKREESLAKKLEQMRRRDGRLVDPLQYAYSIGSSALTDYEPLTPADRAQPTAAQADALEKLGFGAPQTSGEAQRLIDVAQDRNARGLSTPKQIRFLERRGFQHVGKWLFADAKRLIDRYAVCGWKTPRGVTPATYAPPGGYHE